MANLIDVLAATVDPVRLMRRVAEQTCVLVPTADGASVSLLDRDGCFVVTSTHGALAPQLGRVVPIDDTFIGRAVRSGRPQLCSDATDDERLTPAVRTIASRLGVRSSLAIPLFRDATAIGVISVVARPPHAFDDDDIADIASMSGFVSTMINSNTELARLLTELLDDPSTPDQTGPAAAFLASLVVPELAERDRIRSAVDALTRDGGTTAVFQPIVDLAGGRIRAVEGLCRFPDGASPDRWFATAHSAGRGVDLELLALSTMLDAARDLPHGLGVGVNLSPMAALSPAAQATLLDAAAAGDRPLVVELTEHEPAPDPVAESLQPLRDAGVLLAVDDAGAGFAGLTQILRLRPDVLKLDRGLTTGIESDPVRRALATTLVQLAGELGAITVAEGIETERQCAVLRDLGIGFGQGYLFGRPTPAADVPDPPGG